MKKSTRRILALALSLALVCALAVSAFSATETMSASYNGDNIEMYGTLERTTAEAGVSIEYIYGAAYYKIDASITYYPKPGGSTAISAEPHSKSANYDGNNIHTAVREYSTRFTTDRDCFCMIAATFSYTVTFAGSTYRSNTLSVEY